MKLKKRLLSLVLAFSLMCGFCSTQVYAAEKDTVVNANVAAESSATDVSPASVNTAFGPGDHYWGGVTFTGKNGGAYKTINGNQVKVKVAFKAVDNDPTSYHLYLSFVEYGGRVVSYRDYNSWSDEPDSDGYVYYESDWVNVHSGVDYRFLYSSNSECLCDDDRKLNVHIWIEVR